MGIVKETFVAMTPDSPTEELMEEPFVSQQPKRAKKRVKRKSRAKPIIGESNPANGNHQIEVRVDLKLSTITPKLLLRMRKPMKVGKGKRSLKTSSNKKRMQRMMPQKLESVGALAA